jgi:hypothetical protein
VDLSVSWCHNRGVKIGVAGMVVCLGLIGAVRWSARDHVTQAGFWFEDVSFGAGEVQAPRLGGAITSDEMQRIRALAWSELRSAYAGLGVVFSERRDVMYVVRVVQSSKHHPLSPFKWSFESAGESRAIPRMGGSGMVNFRFLANLAIGHAPPAADRATMIDGIGRGVGRSAAHEFAHVFLATESIHRTADIQSYEYRSADRPGQYYGPMRWDVAGPMLAKRLGSTASSSR